MNDGRKPKLIRERSACNNRNIALALTVARKLQKLPFSKGVDENLARTLRDDGRCSRDGKLDCCTDDGKAFSERMLAASQNSFDSEGLI